ncbi:hypothetical protein [Caballeronia ptereochthonis]|uniref:Uncharacterized protein n=1 Tax=Caballeronia ptereochthonis TaxID=1777144 RepID=A0A157ZFN5_9BURK|nr:hypothetical protein [Caballeronia ptereochthonis]SAK44338.1 hypothetical protein AWB83_00539 [Caballeronia ptereochthonis]
MSDASTRRLLSGCAAVLAFGAWYSVNAPHDWSALDRAGYDTELPLERIALGEEAATSIETPQR